MPGTCHLERHRHGEHKPKPCTPYSDGCQDYHTPSLKLNKVRCKPRDIPHNSPVGVSVEGLSTSGGRGMWTSQHATLEVPGTGFAWTPQSLLLHWMHSAILTCLQGPSSSALEQRSFTEDVILRSVEGSSGISSVSGSVVGLVEGAGEGAGAWL